MAIYEDGVLEVWAHLARADVLVLARSSLSYVAGALMSES